MKKFLVLFLCFTLFSNINVFSQESIYGFLALPTGDFGDDSGEGAGYAKTGFGLGAEYTMAIGAPGLGWVTSTTLIFNPHNESAIKELIIDVFEMPDDGMVSTKSTINIPILTGLKYQAEISDGMEIFGAFQVGMNFIKPGNWGGTAGGEIWEMEFIFSSISFGFSIGGGFIFNESFNVDFIYFGLGESEIEGTITNPDGNSRTKNIDQKVGVLAITLGIIF